MDNNILQGKTFLTALFCVVRCILFPGTKIVVCSGTIQQANEILLKIKDELMPKSAILRTEIKDIYVNQNKGEVYFFNDSWIKSRTSTGNSRSARANVIVCDEFRMIDKTVLDTVIRKFLSDPRHPEYLNKKEYAHYQERNKELYLSSAWLKDHWSWTKAQAYTQNFFMDNKKYWICGLPYQISIMENLYMRSQAEDEMSEADFSQTLWDMEMSCMWLGDDDGSFFKLEDFNRARKLEGALLPLEFYNESSPVPDPPPLGKRVMSLDVALMASNKKKKNDAAALFISDLEPSGQTSYRCLFRYGENFEGMLSKDLGILAMRYFYKYKCTDLVLDCQGVGMGVYDTMVEDQYDPETGETWKAMTCINDDDMAARCKDREANKVIWSVKASQKFNTQICIALRDGIKNGKILFLKNELTIDEWLEKNYKPYKKMTLTDKTKVKMPYLQTTLAGFELIKLQTIATSGSDIKVKEESGMRKDRYSSIAYNYWCANQLALQLRPKTQDTQSLVNQLIIRRGSYIGKKI